MGKVWTRNGRMYIPRRDVVDWLRSYTKDIHDNYGLDVFSNYDDAGGVIGYNEYGKPTYVAVNGDCLRLRNSLRGIAMDDFAELMWAAKHEERHLWQYEQYKDPNVTDPFIKHMCEHFVIARRIPEFYWAAYSKDPTEMDADAWSIRQTCDYFHENYPEYDVDDFLVGYFKVKPALSRYVDKDFVDGKDMADTFDEMKHWDNLKAVEGIFTIEVADGPSFRMKALRTKPEFCNRIDSCNSLRGQKNLFGMFLGREDLALYMQYPVLDPRGRSFTSSRAISKGFLNAVKNGGDGRVSSLYGYDGFEDYQKE